MFLMLSKVSRRPSGLRKTKSRVNSLAHRTTWLRSDLGGPGCTAILGDDDIAAIGDNKGVDIIRGDSYICRSCAGIVVLDAVEGHAAIGRLKEPWSHGVRDVDEVGGAKRS